MPPLTTRIDGPVAVIGDLHGDVEKLTSVLDQLRETADFDRRWLVFLGDFIDRGPDPKSVLDLVTDLLVEHPRTTAVAGNHEFAMSAALGLIPVPDYSDWPRQWVNHYETDTTFRSYNAEPGNLSELAELMPDLHQQFAAELPWCVEHPQYLFVHAGLDPNMPFDVQRRILKQKDFSLSRPRWLCEKFTADAGVPPDCPVTVVSGHVHVPRVEFRGQRILLDTNGPGSALSCVLLPEKTLITSSRETVAVRSRSWWKLW